MIMSLIRNKKFSILVILSIIILNFLIFINCEPLTKEVLEYLEKDEETFKNYKANYKLLACKVLTYSRIKYLYEKEEIDKYINQTKNRRGFMDYMQERIFNLCKDNYSDLNMV
jgi:predicted nucleotidyltransferase